MLAKVNCSTADFLLASDLANSCSNYAWLLPFWLTDSYGGFCFVCCRNWFQKIDKIKDSNRQSKQLEELTGKMRECKR
jgi:hypothetical protein